MQKILVTAFIICHIYCLFGQSDTIYYNGAPYIKKFDKKISVRPYFKQKFVFFNINRNNRDTLKGPGVEYAPNSRTAIGISGGYKGYIIGVAFQPKYTSEIEEKYGHTKCTDLRLSLYSRRIGGDAYYNSYTGYYLKNPASFDTSWNKTMNYPLNKNLTVKTTGVNLFYIHREKFSLKAAFGHTERQLISAGSFLMMIAYKNSAFETAVSLIPDGFAHYYPVIDEIRSGSFRTISLAPGYGQTFVYRKWFFSVSAMFGFGLQFQKYSLINEDTKLAKVVAKFNVRSAMGFNGEMFYTGVLFDSDSNTIPIENANLSMTLSSWRLAFGVHI